ncbi:MAG: translocation/assembly module TamB, partial [candidate division WOR-3 bacterium]|nr:translocation/assembly module TamB [candidate division WOR-3 bacterium]
SSSSIVGATKGNGINFNLKIFGERDIWLRNRMADVEFACDLNIISSDEIPIFSGKLNAIQGNLYYLDHILRLTKGEINFDNTTEINPLLDISAELLTRPIKVPNGQTERIKIILTLNGRLKEPIFTFSSDPAYLSESDIITYLTFNVTWQEMTASELRETFTTTVSNKLLGYFERELTKRVRNFIYVDYLWFESGLIGKTGTKITVGKYLGRHLYLTYQYNISGTANDVFRLEYYITKEHQLLGERDEESRYNLKYLYKIRY